MKTLKFGTDGWRAILAEEFTFENARTVVQAIANYIKQKGMAERGILIGHDTRFLSRRFALEAAKVMAANGIKVLLVPEATPTPVVAFGVKLYRTAGAVMFTASHNPPEYNGIKYIPEYAGPATPDITRQLEANIDAIFDGEGRIQVLEEAAGLIEEVHIRPDYEKHIEALIDFEAIGAHPMKVVVDPMHGAGSGYVKRLLEKAGCQVEGIRENPDPCFGGALPEPNEHHLHPLTERLRQAQADLGLANDGDADRFGVVDETGRYISPNLVIALLSLHLIKNRKLSGKIVRTVATTHLIDRIAEKFGIEVIETPVGFKYIGEQMMKERVIIGGEESGGLSIQGHIPEKDGILADLLMAEMCAVEKKPLSQIISGMEEEFGGCYAKRLDIHFDKKNKLMEQLQTVPPKVIGDFQVESVNLMDGVKMLMKDGSWVLVRPSGTEPLLRVYCESLEKEKLSRLLFQVEEWLKQVAEKI